MIVEHWTDSRSSVVLAGSHGTLCRVAERIGLPHGEVVPVTPARSVLALSGCALERYRTRVASRADELALSVGHTATPDALPG